MPRFYFDLHTGDGIAKDPWGALMSDAGSALKLAITCAEEMLGTGELLEAALAHVLFTIRDEQGAAVGRVEVEHVPGTRLRFRSICTQ